MEDNLFSACGKDADGFDNVENLKRRGFDNMIERRLWFARQIVKNNPEFGEQLVYGTVDNPEGIEKYKIKADSEKLKE